MEQSQRRAPRIPNAKSCKRMSEVRKSGGFAGLMPRDRLALELRFGLTGRPPMTLIEVGKNFHVTRERARQIVVEALERINVDPWE